MQCHREYPLRKGKIYFVEPPAAHDSLDILKHRLKQWLGRQYYTVGVHFLAPTYPFDYRREIRRHCNPSEQLIVDLGCGNNRVDDDLIALDSVDYEAADIVADIGALPFRDAAVDGFASRSVMEHVPNLPLVIEEVKRCTRPGGVGVHLIPFLFPYHASPRDYFRLTHSGAAQVFSGWQIVEQRNATGPITLAVACAAEFLSIVLSFGQPRLKAAAYLAACVLMSPLKFLDAPFVARKAFLSLAPTILSVVRKPYRDEVLREKS
jgi:SAM-dependent methyltransferase